MKTHSKSFFVKARRKHKETLKCSVCGKTNHLSGHHIVPERLRELGKTHEIYSLCRQCHNLLELYLMEKLQKFYANHILKIPDYFKLRGKFNNYVEELKNPLSKIAPENAEFIINYIKTYSPIMQANSSETPEVLMDYELAKKFGRHKIIKWYRNINEQGIEHFKKKLLDK